MVVLKSQSWLPVERCCFKELNHVGYVTPLKEINTLWVATKWEVCWCLLTDFYLFIYFEFNIEIGALLLLISLTKNDSWSGIYGKSSDLK